MIEEIIFKRKPLYSSAYLFSSPDKKSRVISSKAEEEILVDCNQSAGMNWGRV